MMDVKQLKELHEQGVIHLHCGRGSEMISIIYPSHIENDIPGGSQQRNYLYSVQSGELLKSEGEGERKYQRLITKENKGWDGELFSILNAE